MVSFGENVYLWRIFRGLSQEELAKRTGIPRPNLSAIESGKREVSLATLRLLAMGLGVIPGVLVDGIAPMHFKRSNLSRELLENIVLASLGKLKTPFNSKVTAISTMLSKIIRNRINAKKKIYKSSLGERHTYIINWLMLKEAVGRTTLDNLLTRLDKYIELG